ncbi:unnamed protein product [Protopolystoma xenopodis]|uniref:Uncharacterized protein n=1 Tax=Protopolystoma xenopodis TaxID=117903 RepID=A0A3S5AJ06_9PLAT|nr:unnamed protein product [Protopolystoma xenopodis]
MAINKPFRLYDERKLLPARLLFQVQRHLAATRRQQPVSSVGQSFQLQPNQPLQQQQQYLSDQHTVHFSTNSLQPSGRPANPISIASSTNPTSMLTDVRDGPAKIASPRTRESLANPGTWLYGHYSWHPNFAKNKTVHHNNATSSR